MSFHLAQTIESLRISSMNRLEKAVQTVGSCRHYDVVHVIRHETVSDTLNGKSPRVISQQSQVRLVVAIGKEDRLASVPSLRYVVGHAWDEYASFSRHA